MYPDTPTPKFYTVEYNIIVLATNFLRLRINQGQIFLYRCSEGVMGGDIAAFFFLEMHQRKINDPEEFPVLWIAKLLTSFFKQGRGFQTDASQNITGTFPTTRGKEYNVTISYFEFGFERILFNLRKEFQDGGFPLTPSDLIKASPLAPRDFAVSSKCFNSPWVISASPLALNALTAPPD